MPHGTSDPWAALTAETSTSTTTGVVKDPSVTFDKHFPKNHQKPTFTASDKTTMRTQLAFVGVNGFLLILNSIHGFGWAATISLIGLGFASLSYLLKRYSKKSAEAYAHHHDKEDPDFIKLSETTGTQEVIKVVKGHYDTLLTTATDDLHHHQGPWSDLEGQQRLWDTWQDIRLIAASEESTFPREALHLAEDAKKRVLQTTNDLQDRTRATLAQKAREEEDEALQQHYRIAAAAEVRTDRLREQVKRRSEQDRLTE